MSTEAKRRANAKYEGQVQRVTLSYRKDEHVGDTWRKWAAKAGVPLSQFMRMAAQEKAERDGLINAVEVTQD